MVTDAAHENQKPKNEQGLDAVGESVCLKGPGYVGGGDEDDGQASVARRGQEFMQSPVLEDEVENEHDDSESVECDHWRDLSIPETFPDPFQDGQRESIGQPEREDATGWMRRSEFPCFIRGPAKDLSCKNSQYTYGK